ncbi:MAG: flagellar biosynthetic protein FliO [Gammaproteobacteria bacterium]|nr:flagellar biosynthetic protein FliO [Gammaproteobacteria bacterium]
MAQSTAQQAIAIDPVSPSYMMKLTAGLLAVVAIIFIVAWMLKRFNLTQQSQNGLIRVIAGLPLGTRDRIVLLQVGNEQILVGLSPGRIEKLHTLSAPVVDERKSETTPFASKVNELMGKD